MDLPSTTLTLNEHVLLLFDESRPTQLTVVEPGLKFDPDTREHVMLAPGALSLTLAVKLTGTYDLLLNVLSDTDEGHDTNGGSESVTLILNEHVPLLPAASTAKHVTVVEPTANCVEALGEHSDVTTPVLSLVIGLA
jgi:hypothetical protein